MTVYADQVFALNTLVNYFLLRTAVTLTGGSRGRRLWCGAGIGGLYAVCASLPALAFLASLPGVLGAFVLLCGACFGFRGGAWRAWLWFFGVCCGFAGLTLAAVHLLRLPALSAGGRVWYRIPGWLLALLAAGLYLLCRLCLDCFARHRGGELTELTITAAGRSLRCTALRDNGNTLREPISGGAVYVARWQVAARLLPELGLGQARFRDPAALAEELRLLVPALPIRLVPYRAVGTEGGLLLAIRPDVMLVNGKPAAADYLAFSPTEVSDGGLYEVLCPGDRIC